MDKATQAANFTGEKLQQGYEFSKPYLNKAGEYTMDKAKQSVDNLEHFTKNTVIPQSQNIANQVGNYAKEQAQHAYNYATEQAQHAYNHAYNYVTKKNIVDPKGPHEVVVVQQAPNQVITNFKNNMRQKVKDQIVVNQVPAGVEHPVVVEPQQAPAGEEHLVVVEPQQAPAGEEHLVVLNNVKNKIHQKVEDRKKAPAKKAAAQNAVVINNFKNKMRQKVEDRKKAPAKKAAAQNAVVINNFKNKMRQKVEDQKKAPAQKATAQKALAKNVSTKKTDSKAAKKGVKKAA
jgi:hypothetical protein